ncbi:MAG: regulator of cell autolysis [Flavobacterium sp. BFFFF1]|uniref:tetratricopeptide repeat-containing sensor histidine kinase n=1 Tax=Flavobacterium sp. BFFFF1 TaxID=2015557 RepID=UPI000BD27B37|nr:histidine kinase [Flavobacterium sp. BFFFF1]OYU82317.1 MAG: regulator of cell autolysis [Flavobacterium sp. BFFFF1]
MSHLRHTFYSLLLLLLIPASVRPQDTVKKLQPPEEKKVKSKTNSVARELKDSFEKNDQQRIARNYEALAETFIKKEDYAKAEEYLKKAILYTKSDQTEDLARLRRSIAKVQENQKKFGPAVTNYKKAAATTDNKLLEQMNSNDFKRLENAGNPQAQESYSRSNISLADKSANKEEAADAYIQNAELNVRTNNAVGAIESYEKAITYSKDRPDEVIKIKNEIAKVYTSGKQFDKAIEIHGKLLDDARKNKDSDNEIRQLSLLSNVYFKNSQSEKAVDLLKEAYQIAAKNGRTNDAKASLSKLLEYYKSVGNNQESLALYEGFFKNFDALVRADSSLVDAKTFQVTEERIRQLEKEKGLKDELIAKKNTFNYFLIGSMLLLLLFVGLIAKALYSIKIKNKEIALQSLRREMNPHFIFNSLNSVNQFISQNNELEANKYLSSYSVLMRNMMENSNKDFVSLSNEIEQLTKYLDLEHLRFPDQFTYNIIVDDEIDAEQSLIPNMIIQPHLENAIWHGLRYIESKGFLTLSFTLEQRKIIVRIEDNGIGLERSAALKTANQKIHQSRGITNTKERIALLNDLYKKEIAFSIAEKTPPETGTVVTITFPLTHKI